MASVLLAPLLLLALAQARPAAVPPATGASSGTDGCCAVVGAGQEAGPASGCCCVADAASAGRPGADTCCAAETASGAPNTGGASLPAVAGPGCGDDEACCMEKGTCACQPTAPAGHAFLSAAMVLPRPSGMRERIPFTTDQILDGGLAPPEQPPRS